jgi:hypothetical protein
MAMAPILIVAVAVWGAVLLVYACLLLHQALRGPQVDVLLLRLRRWWPLPAPRLNRLERRIVRRVLASGIPDRRRRVVWLPGDIEVLLAPSDLRALGAAAERLRTRVRRRLESLERTQACRFHLPPVVAVVDDPGCRPGHPVFRTAWRVPVEPTYDRCAPLAHGCACETAAASGSGAFAPATWWSASRRSAARTR